MAAHPQLASMAPSTSASDARQDESRGSANGSAAVTAAPPALAPRQRRPPEAPPRKKRKRVKGDVLSEQKYLVETLAVDLVNDRVNFRSVYGHCTTTCSENLRSFLDRLVQKDPVLVNVMKDCNRADPELVADALEAISSTHAATR